MIAANALNQHIGSLVRRYLARPFSHRPNKRALLCYAINRISFSQAYPFLHYSKELQRRFRMEFRAVPIEPLLDGARLLHSDVDWIFVQPWFDVDPDSLSRLLERLSATYPAATLVFLDSYAHSDLRLGRVVDPFVDYYYKKSRFLDKSLYTRQWLGGTNLTEYYGELYGIPSEPVNWNTPPNIISKVRLSPNFLTAPRFLAAFTAQDPPLRSERPIDLHARLGSSESGWYGAMRQAAHNALKPLDDLKLASVGSVPQGVFMQELGAAKLCFSPFGYGELCWRDVEAIQTGAVMIKPCMNHLETLPNLYEPEVTYLPCRWDFSDLEEVVRGALANENRRARIAETAWQRAANYVQNGQFVDEIGNLF